MRLFKIISANFKQSRLRNIIMIIFVGASVFLMNMSLSGFMHREYLNNYVRICGLYDDYMYVTDSYKSVYYQSGYSDGQDNSVNKRQQAREYIREQLDGLKEKGIVEGSYSVSHFNAPISYDITDRAEFLIYPKALAYELRFPVSSGKWFEENVAGNEYTPVVVSSDMSLRFKVGDVIDSRYLEKTGLVVGVLEPNAMVLSPGAGGNTIDLNNVFTTADNMIIACVDEISERDEMGTKVIKVSPQNQQEVFDSVGDITYAFTFKDMSDRAYESNSLLTEMQTVVFVLMLIVCITGVSSSNLLETISCKKRYAVYFMCGMDWADSVKITFIQSLLKLVVPAGLGYLGFIWWWSGVRDYYPLRVTGVNIIMTILFILTVFVLTSLKPLFDIKRTSPVKIISEI